MARSSVMTSSRQRGVHFPPVSAHTLLSHFGHGRQRESMCASHGLFNAPGDNNCFLNSAVQIFWHLDVFRRSFRRLTKHVCLDDACIFCAFKEIFGHFSSSVGQAFAPDVLRQALASTFQDQQRFQLGKMDDAAECFENILLRIHYHVQGSSEVTSCVDPSIPCITHRIFAMDLNESVFCPDCCKSTQSLTFSQMVHYVTVEDLLQKSGELKQRGVKSTTGLFGKLIRKSNENDQGRCCRHCLSSSTQLKHTLTNRPVVVTIGFAWSSEKPRTQTISDVLSTIDTNICLMHLCHSVSDTEWASSAVHHLVGMICFYRHHYVAFCYHSRYQTWLCFDDSSVKAIGPDWTQVTAQCLKNHMQPLLLFYANPECDLIGGDDLRSGTASSASMGSTLSRLPKEPVRNLDDNDHDGNVKGKPAPPRPPVRTISRPVPNKKSDHVSPSTAEQTLDRTSQLPHADTRRCSRKNSRSSVTSSSVASTESYASNSSYDIYAASYTLRSRCRNSLESSSLKDETDSGYPSGDHVSASSSSTSGSSVEAPAVKRETFAPSPSSFKEKFDGPFDYTSRVQYIQMLLRADDLISSASLKEEHGELSGAIKLFGQAADLLQSCLEPLRACKELSHSVQTKHVDCQRRLRTLRDKITTCRSGSTTSASTSTASYGLIDHQSEQYLPTSGLATLPRHPRTAQFALPVPQEATTKRMHKSRRKASAKGQLGTTQLNRSLPDLSASETSPKSLLPTSTFSKLSTFEAPPESGETLRARKVVRESLLNELNQRLRKLPQQTCQPTGNDYLPPPPPELLGDYDRFLELKIQDCTLCGHKPCISQNSTYCADCSIYMSRFSRI